LSGVRDGGGSLLSNDVPQTRMYRWSQADGLSVFLEPSGYAGPPLDTIREGGANGLFTEAEGTVLLADSGNRLIARFNAADKSRVTLAESFEDKRFNSPNDVVARGDGTVFFKIGRARVGKGGGGGGGAGRPRGRADRDHGRRS